MPPSKPPRIYHCLRLPASGGPVEFLPYTPVKTSTLPKGDDYGFEVVADLRPHWTGDYQDRLIQRFILPHGYGAELVLYYSTNVAKPANKTLLDMPAVHGDLAESFRTGEIFDRMFYRGDVFVVQLRKVWDKDFKVRFEDMDQDEDVVPDMVDIVGILVAENWKEGFLEHQRSMNEFFKLGERARGIKILTLTQRSISENWGGDEGGKVYGINDDDIVDDPILRLLRRRKRDEPAGVNEE